MASDFTTDALRKVQHAPAAYAQLLDQIITKVPPQQLPPDLLEYIRSAISDSLGIISSRTILNDFTQQLQKINDPETRITIGTQTIDTIAAKAVSLEEQDTAIKLVVADAYEANEDFTSSAKVLQTINLDSSQRVVSSDDKARTWIRITRCYLEEDDPTSALTYLNRIKNVIFDVTDQAVRLQFQLSQARISDSQRNFADASRTYYAISQETIIDEDERLQALSAAVVCAVLAPAGPQRAQQLSRLFRDDRATQLEEYPILEKITLDQVLAPAEVKTFAAKLQPHQLAVMSDGSTVLDKAVLEHNLLAASRLYNNIGTAQLGVMLGVDNEKAELYAAQMIEQGRLAGYIDQIAELIHFERRGDAGKVAAGSKAQRLWDDNVKSLAEEVEKVTTTIQVEYPDFYTANMVH